MDVYVVDGSDQEEIESNGKKIIKEWMEDEDGSWGDVPGIESVQFLEEQTPSVPTFEDEGDDDETTERGGIGLAEEGGGDGSEEDDGFGAGPIVGISVAAAMAVGFIVAGAAARKRAIDNNTELSA